MASGERQLCLGGGNGQSPGAAAGYGGLYWLDPAKYTDDDYGRIFPYYTTYFFLNHEKEQEMGVGVHRKLYDYATAFVEEIGTVQLVPLVNKLTNPGWATPAYTMQTAMDHDFEWGLNITGERCAFQVLPAPLAGTTDVAFNLQKLIINLRKDPAMGRRGVV